MTGSTSALRGTRLWRWSRLIGDRRHRGKYHDCGVLVYVGLTTPQSVDVLVIEIHIDESTQATVLVGGCRAKL